MEQIKKIKVALVCYFSTAQVRDLLPLDNRKLYAFVRRILGLPINNRGYGDIAPWTSNLISKLSKRDDIELHVISAISGLKQMQYSLDIDNVNYYFVKADFSTLLKKLIKNDNLWRKLNPMRLVVRRLVSQISPDIVNLVGAENAFISGTILDIHNYPVFVICQTIYNNPDRSKYDVVDSKNASTELLIFQKESYYGVRNKMHHDLLISHKPNALVFDYQWPLTIMPEVNKIVYKKYDFVNFAVSLSLKKGFHDSIQAIAIVKKKYPNVKLNLVGGGDSNTKQELDSLIDSLDVKDNVVFTSFFEKQKDMFQHIQNSRFAVLPCKIDNISGTMLQAMYYELPLVVYNTPGTPSLNKDKECVLISELSNVESLADNMLLLMDDPQKANNLLQNAKMHMSDTTDNDKKVDRLVLDYKAIIEHYHNNTDIPHHLLFNLNS